jgi:tRNA pseudouridine55 synthase
MNEILLVDKPANWTSFDVVAKIRGAYSKREGHRVKVGHTGTLDPFATGLLIVLLGDATKNQDTFMKLEKGYDATLKLGVASSTGDPEGVLKTTLKSNYKIPTEAEISKCLATFMGRISQTPSKYSSIKVNGKRAYLLARKGEDFEMSARDITIYDIKIVSYNWPDLKISVACSSGTYIRTLAEDIGITLGCGAYLTTLRRTKIGDYKIDAAKEINDIIGLLTKEK